MQSARKIAQQAVGVTTTPERSVFVREARKLTSGDLVRMRLPERYWNASFDAISEGKHKVVTQRFLAKIPELMAKGMGLLLWGDNSTGKTSVASVIAKQARRLGFTVLVLRTSELVRGDLRREWYSADKTKSVYDRAKEVDMLVLDDLGKEHHAASGYEVGYATDLLEDLIRDRVARCKSLVVTTNIDPSTIGKKSDADDLQLYKKSMREVMKGSVFPVKVEGKNFRKEEAKALEELLGTDE